MNSWKMNTNASWNQRTKVGGICDSDRWIPHMLQAETNQLKMVCQSARSQREGLRCINYFFKESRVPLEVESDALEVIDILNGCSEDLT